MAFDGNGNFVRLYSWQNDATNGIDITASRVDGEDTGFATGLSLCVTRDGQGKMAADFVPAADATYGLGTSLVKWTSINGLILATGSFTLTASSGFASTPAVTVQWQRFGNMMMLSIPSILAASTNNTLIMTGLSAALWPAVTQDVPFGCIVNLSTQEGGGALQIQSTGNLILLRNGAIGGFSGTGNKGFFDTTVIMYSMV